jgi:nickel/cobalt exporter
LPDQLYPWLGFASGALIAVVGVVLFLQRRRAWRRTGSLLPASLVQTGHMHTHEASPDHVHDHDHGHTHDHDSHEHDHAHGQMHTHADGHTHDHDHDHEHTHDHDHTHSHDEAVPHSHGLFSRPHTHVPVDGQRVSAGSLLALGITGGIIPCPSALIVLLAAVAYHQVGLGLILILAFSLGLAGVLMGIGLLMVYGRGLLGRVRLNLGGSLLARMPMASALAVSCLGLLIAFEALSAGGILR